ncbi:MAG TPA: DUF192 domain-containing protein [Gammaproteobacteria bacterium]|nr:DUF192 domain-containing protein [Gammaproteobacteria bacterium]
MTRGAIRLGGWLGGLLAGVAAAGELPETTVRCGEAGLTAEVAVTSTERARGLSGRDRLAPDRGMLFVWPGEEPRRFWMKDTRIPLSVAFLDRRGRILNIHRMAPPAVTTRFGVPDGGFRRYPSRGPARFALEANRGWFAAHGIEPGDRCAFRLAAGVAGAEPLAVGGGS